MHRCRQIFQAAHDAGVNGRRRADLLRVIVPATELTLKVWTAAWFGGVTRML